MDLYCKTRGRYLVSLTPTTYGEYLITCTFSGEEIPSGPYKLVIEDPNEIVTQEQTVNVIEQEVDMTFDIPEGQWDVNIFVQCPDDEMMSSSLYSVTRDEDGFQHVKFTPEKPGTYKVSFEYTPS